MYCLVDKELQEKIEQIVPCFKAYLEGAISSKYYDDKSAVMLRVFVKDIEISFSIPKFLIKKDKEFNPLIWNPYPEITPPENIPLKVWVDHSEALNKYFIGYCIKGQWCDDHKNPLNRPDWQINSIKFKAWD